MKSFAGVARSYRSKGDLQHRWGNAVTFVGTGHAREQGQHGRFAGTARSYRSKGSLRRRGRNAVIFVGTGHARERGRH